MIPTSDLDKAMKLLRQWAESIEMHEHHSAEDAYALYTATRDLVDEYADEKVRRILSKEETWPENISGTEED